MTNSYFFLQAPNSTVIINAPIGMSPSVAYWGPRLAIDPNDHHVCARMAEQIFKLRQKQGTQGGALVHVKPSLSCEVGTGYLGPIGLQLSRSEPSGKDFDVLLTTKHVESGSDHITIHCEDPTKGIATAYIFTRSDLHDVITIQLIVENTGHSPLTINHAAIGCMTLEPELEEIISFSGRWSDEFQTNRHPLTQGGYICENLRGRTSHDRFPGMIFCTPTTTERAGPAFGMHLGWSGNHHMRVEKLTDGQNIVQIGEYFYAGEKQLNTGEHYKSPKLYAAFNPNGLSAMSQAFHKFYRTQLTDHRTKQKPRPIHYNTWEAIYFDHSEETLKKLADSAAKVGAERFVLDDGWFLGRRHEQAGLGDWQVDKTIYPNGLQPIIDYVKSKNMEFGLWVEPEMVNADSNFYRNNPDWILSASPHDQVPFRYQYVIDLTRKEARENIFTQINEILNEYPDIAYLKWDMNRDLNQPGGHASTPAAHDQTHAVYALIDQLRNAHPHVEIESCSSGGARIDYGILERTDRIWTSDSNDALDRQKIQRGASYFFPLDIMGAHVGPRECHITKRILSMGLRAGTAIFGHMGVEANLLTMCEDDLDELSIAFSQHKKYRNLLHTGDLIRLDGPQYQNAIAVISADKTQALYSYTQIATIQESLPGVLKFPGLDPQKNYRLKCVWPSKVSTPFPHRLENSELMADGFFASGEVLEKIGLQIPVLFTDTCLVFEVSEIPLQ